MNPKLICDISNIACYNKRKSKAKLGYIDLLFATISPQFEIVAIADASLYFHIDDQKRYKKDYLLPQRILEAPAGEKADVFILKYAQLNDCLIISNDHFREYHQYSSDWMETHRIPFMIVDNQLMLNFKTHTESNKRELKDLFMHEKIRTLEVEMV